MPHGICYKLTDHNMQTHNGFQWRLSDWYTTNGEGGLCGPGWLHGYGDPLVALLHNPIHADIARPRLFRAEWGGAIQDDRGLKLGVTAMRLAQELPVPTIPESAPRLYAIRCAIEVAPYWRGREPERFSVWRAWAEKLIKGGQPDVAHAVAAAACAAVAACAAATDAAYQAADAAVATDAAQAAATDDAAAAAYAATYAADAAANATDAGPLDFPRFAREAVILAAWHDRTP